MQNSAFGNKALVSQSFIKFSKSLCFPRAVARGDCSPDAITDNKAATTTSMIAAAVTASFIGIWKWLSFRGERCFVPANGKQKNRIPACAGMTALQNVFFIVSGNLTQKIETKNTAVESNLVSLTVSLPRKRESRFLFRKEMRRIRDLPFETITPFSCISNTAQHWAVMACADQPFLRRYHARKAV